MRFRPGGPGVLVQWFRAKPGAKLFPGEHGYYSLNWEDDHAPSPVGEDRSLMVPRWANGSGPALLDGHCVRCVDPSLFGSDGVPPGITGPVVVTSNGVPITCLSVPAGGLLFGGDATRPKGRGGMLWSGSAGTNVLVPCCGSVVLPPLLRANPLPGSGVFYIRWDPVRQWYYGTSRGTPGPLTFCWLVCSGMPAGWTASVNTTGFPGPFFGPGSPVVCSPFSFSNAQVNVFP